MNVFGIRAVTDCLGSPDDDRTGAVLWGSKEMNFVKVMVLGVAIGVSSLAATSVSAATCTPTSGGGNSNKLIGLTDTLYGGSALDTYCSKAVEDEGGKGKGKDKEGSEKNDGLEQINGLALFGSSKWILGDKTDDNTDGDIISLVLKPTTGATEDNKGTWSLVTDFTFEKIMITLKTGAGYGAFLIDPKKALTGSWWTETGDLSHASVFYTGASRDSFVPVPLPATAWMLIAALGGLAAVRRRSA